MYWYIYKAIRDGVIEAHIDHEAGYVKTKDISDIYSSLEPMKAFNQRIKFCLELRNQSVKAMRFPPKKYSEELETAEVWTWIWLFFKCTIYKKKNWIRRDEPEKRRS